jgi:hypothetical protein
MSALRAAAQFADLGFVFPGGVLVAGGAGPEAGAQDAGEPVRGVGGDD